MLPTETPGGNATTAMPPTESPTKKKGKMISFRLTRSKIAETISFKSVLKL